MITEEKSMSKKLTFEDVKSERCDHCTHNPSATRPFHKMKHFKLNELDQKIVDKLAEQTGLKPNCIVCASVRKLVKMPIEEVLKRGPKEGPFPKGRKWAIPKNTFIAFGLVHEEWLKLKKWKDKNHRIVIDVLRDNEVLILNETLIDKHHVRKQEKQDKA